MAITTPDHEGARLGTDVFTSKECPVCRARVFSDMPVCYNCMYRFGSDQALEAAVKRKEQETSAGASSERASLDATLPDLAPTESRAVPKDTDKAGAAAMSVESRTTDEGESCSERRSDESLLAEFLVEFERFLRDFLLNRKIGIKELVPLVREFAPVSTVTDEELDG